MSDNRVSPTGRPRSLPVGIFRTSGFVISVDVHSARMDDFEEMQAWKRTQAHLRKRGLPSPVGGWRAEKARRLKRLAEDKVRSNLYGATTRIVDRAGEKPERSMSMLGCTLAEARARIEAQFRPGMSWENHGEWEIDHIRPVASFDLTDPDQARAAAHFTNLQPLWSVENRRKGVRWNLAATPSEAL